MAAAAELAVFPGTGTEYDYYYDVPEVSDVSDFPDVPEGEVYARSLRAYRAAGQLAVAGSVSLEELERQEADRPDEIEALWQEQLSVLAEMFKSDKALAELIEVSRFDEYGTRDGQVIAYDGKTPVVELCAAGYEKSCQAAEDDGRLKPQARRDHGDLRNARAVDGMVRGETDHNTRLVRSPSPKEAIERDGAKFWRDLYGYEEGLDYLQLYHVTKDGTVLTGAFSVDKSDPDAWREVFAEFGTEVPEGTHSDDWLQYAITGTMDDDQARELITKVRHRFYERIGHANDTQSVEELLESQKPMLRAMFRALSLPLAESIETRRKLPEVDAFADRMLQSPPDDVDPEIIRELVRMRNRDAFDDQSGRVVAQLINYAMAVGIREQVKAASQGEDAGNVYSFGGMPSIEFRGMDVVVDNQMMIEFMSRSIESGISQGLSFTACGGLTSVSKEGSDDSTTNGRNPQDVFGGSAGRSGGEAGGGNADCVYTHNGCYCCSYNSDGTSRDTKLTVKALRRSDGSASCLRSGCNAYLPPQGAIGNIMKNIGSIAQRARELQARQAQQPEAEPVADDVTEERAGENTVIAISEYRRRRSAVDAAEADADGDDNEAPAAASSIRLQPAESA